jgi:ATP-dependent helicase/DNAse subunit B
VETYSYSKLSTFDLCPYKYYLQYVLKIKTPFSDNATLEKGRFLHYLLENYPDLTVTYKLKYPEVKNKEQFYREFIRELAKTAKNVKFLLQEDTIVAREQNFYLDANFKIVEKKSESTYNGIIDYVGQFNRMILLVDWKSGSTQTLASLDQLMFYASWAFAKFPGTIKVKCYLMFIEQNEFKHITVTRAMLKEIQDKYRQKVATIESTTEFKKCRNDKCQWCAFATDCNKIPTSRTKETKE